MQRSRELRGGGNHDELDSHLSVIESTEGWVTLVISGPRRGRGQHIQVPIDDLIRALNYVSAP